MSKVVAAKLTEVVGPEGSVGEKGATGIAGAQCSTGPVGYEGTTEVRTPKALWVTGAEVIPTCIYAYLDEKDELQAFVGDKLTAEYVATAKLKEYPIAAEFNVPNKLQLDRYRQIANKVDGDTGIQIIDRVLLRRLILKNHLISITVDDPDTKEQIKIERDSKGKMTPEVEKKLLNLHPTILDMLLVQYETRANLM
jgi:hypothetical protein